MQTRPRETVRQQAVGPEPGYRNLLVEEIPAESGCKAKRVSQVPAPTGADAAVLTQPQAGGSAPLSLTFASRWLVKRCFVRLRGSPRCAAGAFPRSSEVSQQQSDLGELSAERTGIAIRCRAGRSSATSRFSGPRPVLGLETAHKFSYASHRSRNVH